MGDKSLARHIAVHDSVVVGPLVRVPVMACCLMPHVQVVHIHCDSDASAGLLLTLSRSVLYIFTCRTQYVAKRNPLRHAIFNRAAGLIFPDGKIATSHSIADYLVPTDVIADARRDDARDTHTNNRIAADHVRIYQRVVGSGRIPTLLL